MRCGQKMLMEWNRPEDEAMQELKREIWYNTQAQRQEVSKGN